MVAPVSVSVVGVSEPQADRARGKARAQNKAGRIRIGFDLHPLKGPGMKPLRASATPEWPWSAYTGCHGQAQRRQDDRFCPLWLVLEGVMEALALPIGRMRRLGVAAGLRSEERRVGKEGRARW